MTLTSLLFTLVAAYSQSGAIEFHSVLTLGPVGRGGRIPVTTNALLDSIVSGDFTIPKVAESVTSTTGEIRIWKENLVGKDGWFTAEDFSGGFAFATYDSPDDRVMILEATGHSFVYVNGEPRGGDPYSFGFTCLPVSINKGENIFLFNVGRGRLRFRLVGVESGVFVETRDATLPDLIVGEYGDRVGAILVTNATPLTMRGFKLKIEIANGKKREKLLPDMPPLSFLKVPISFAQPNSLVEDKLRLTVAVHDSKDQSQRKPVEFEMDVRQPYQQHKRTFTSKVDGSVQYYAVQPPFKENLATADAVILSVHGAGVEAVSQAGAYGQKSWATLIAPTNRRPYGFDWEDWGRLDAMEALEDAKRIYKHREDRIYLTGHSMGGHGTWYLGATHPDQWGAIGPAAGWINFWSYGGAVTYENPDPIENMLLRVSSPSDPLKIINNYSAFGVYVLHGDADDTVPIKQARDMREKLGAFHRDVDFHEQPGGGHWYDSTPEAGADCVDYGPMFDFFDKHRRRLSNDVRSFQFSTTSPQISATCYWTTIYAQKIPYLTSTISAINPIGTARFEITTTNISRLVLEVSKSPIVRETSHVEISIDGNDLIAELSPDKVLTLEYVAGSWQIAPTFDKSQKSPVRGGIFKSAFNNNFVLVYGTTGTPEENAWSYAKARYDAETWWYRGNGYVEIAADTDYTSRNAVRRLNNLILYGNEDTNGLAAILLAESTVHIKRGSMTIGIKKLIGDDLSLMMIRPNFSDVNPINGLSNAHLSFAIIGGTGIEGMRATNTMPYFVSGVHYPDLMAFRSSINLIGTKAIEVAGIFGNDWSVANGDFVWRDAK